MLLHGQPVPVVSLFEALLGFYEFLSIFKKKCILTAHNCSFDRPRFMAAVEKVFLTEHFKNIVYGFCDTLPIIRKVTGKKGKGCNKLKNLAQEFEINCDKAHDALFDVIMLSHIIKKLEIKNVHLKNCILTWSAANEKINLSKTISSSLPNLNKLKDCLSLEMRKKMIAANITYDMVVNTYLNNQLNGLTELFGNDENGKVKVTKRKNIIKRLYDYLHRSFCK